MSLLLVLVACRPDPGKPAYPVYDTAALDTDSASDFLRGPDPWVEGEPRFSFGIFYEGGSTQVELFDNLFIYESTFSATFSDDRVEGLSSDVWVHAGGPWWGGGVHWNAARDLSGWSTLNLDLKAPAAGGIASVDIAMTGGLEGKLSAAAYTFAADDAWHHLVIPLADFAAAGTDLSQVTIPLVLVGEGGSDGDIVLIDNLYLE